MGGESPNVLRTARRAVLACMAATTLALTLSSCGSDESPESFAPNNVISAPELARDPEGSAERAFAEYWSALQFRAWADVAAYYDPALRDFVGTASLIGAKKLEASSYALLKPDIIRLKQAADQTTIYYTLRLPDGTKELDSITWREDDGNWSVIHDSRLDPELAQLAQNKVELKISERLPTEASEVSGQALRAGNAAGQMQARFLEQEFDQG